MLKPYPGWLFYRKQSPKSTSEHCTSLLVLQLLQSPDCRLDCDSRRCAAKQKKNSWLFKLFKSILTHRSQLDSDSFRSWPVNPFLKATAKNFYLQHKPSLSVSIQILIQMFPLRPDGRLNFKIKVGVLTAFFRSVTHIAIVFKFDLKRQTMSNSHVWLKTKLSDYFYFPNRKKWWQ